MAAGRLAVLQRHTDRQQRPNRTSTPLTPGLFPIKEQALSLRAYGSMLFFWCGFFFFFLAYYYGALPQSLAKAQALKGLTDIHIDTAPMTNTQAERIFPRSEPLSLSFALSVTERHSGCVCVCVSCLVGLAASKGAKSDKETFLKTTPSTR